MTNRPRSGCAINVAVEVLGDNWSLIVLRDIIFGGMRHFRELLTLNDEGIASNILASRLKKLVDEGLRTKAEAVRRQRAEYSLTEAGVETLPDMVALGTWGMTHRTTSWELAISSGLMAEEPRLGADLMAARSEIDLSVRRPPPQPTGRLAPTGRVRRRRLPLAQSDGPLVRSRPVWFPGKGDCIIQSLNGDNDHEGAIMFNGLTATISVGGERTAANWYARLLD